ncbi:MAG: hypothetical protein KKA32_10460 [Actinobacteria bacterium]|nr:hypothetical protein [Actinomycetota bacterium]
MNTEPTSEDRIFDQAEERLKDSHHFDEASAKSVVDLLRSKAAALKASDVLSVLAALEDGCHEDS